MSIEFARAYKTSDGKCHATLEQAQEQELVQMLKPTSDTGVLDAIRFFVANASQVVDILTMTERSRPKARKVNGGRKPRKNRVTEPVQTTSA